MMKCRMSDGSTATLVIDENVPIGDLEPDGESVSFDFSPSPLPIGVSETPPESVNMAFVDYMAPSEVSGAKVNAHLGYNGWSWDEDVQDAVYNVAIYVDDVAVSKMNMVISGDESPMVVTI